MTLINISDLKQQLLLENISHEFTDDKLELLLDNTITELIGYTGLPILPVSHKTIVRKFHSNILELDHYPINEIQSLKIGSTKLSDDDYVLDDTLGILYFNSVLKGLLSCQYTCQLSDDVIDNLINPLVFDMVKYRLTSNFSTTGVMSSIKEGDVSVNYDTSSSLGNLILSRINNLKATYSIRIKVL